MKNLSLKLRSLLVAFIALALFIPFSVFTLDKAFTESLTQAKHNELKLMNLALVSAFELDGDVPYMPELLYEEQLNLPDSGYIGLIVFRGEIVWKSASALHNTINQPPAPATVGEERFLLTEEGSIERLSSYFTYAFTAEFASERDFEPVHFYIINDKTEFNLEREAYLHRLWQWLAMLAVGLLILLLVGINVVLNPVRQLISEISRTANGRQPHLSQRYPVEFIPLKNSINRLIDVEAEQRSRYKNSLGDLAHSLKTPLAVAMGSPALPDETSEALQQIDNIIRRQLKRSAAAKSGWQAKVDVEPLGKKLISAMKKVHRERNLQFALEVLGTCELRGDETDLMEMLGNLLDNACKAANGIVQLTLKQEGEWHQIIVEDDGPGIPHAQKSVLLERGKRLDTYIEGQGIGMAVVSDLVAIYEGRLEIENSPLGGAKVILSFPVTQ